jgi:hypothetical protein
MDLGTRGLNPFTLADPSQTQSLISAESDPHSKDLMIQIIAFRGLGPRFNDLTIGNPICVAATQPFESESDKRLDP